MVTIKFLGFNLSVKDCRIFEDPKVVNEGGLRLRKRPLISMVTSLSSNPLEIRNTIILPVLIALILRVLLFFYIAFNNLSFMIQPDSLSYINPAENLLKHGLFASGEHPNLKPETLRTPSYPLFIALAYLLFGKRVESIIILQIFLGAFLPILACKILEELGASSRVRSIGACLTALDPLLLIYTVNVFDGRALRLRYGLSNSFIYQAFKEGLSHPSIFNFASFRFSSLY